MSGVVIASNDRVRLGLRLLSTYNPSFGSTEPTNDVEHVMRNLGPTRERAPADASPMGLAFDERFGVLYVGTPERLAALPVSAPPIGRHPILPSRP